MRAHWHPYSLYRLTLKAGAALALVVLAACDAPPTTFAELAEDRLPQIAGTITVPGLSAEVEVIRDSWGVPHIYAGSLDDLFLAQGFVQAQDRLWQ
ncbi:MAG: penicillin acylase family protein, partial [Gemmatimonadetes bacterium]|nr:penicillin acylase family protein [Gemmatimonadota bacterium]